MPFDDFYVRVPLDRLAREADGLEAAGLAPEIAVGNAALDALDRSKRLRARGLASRFARHTLHAPFIDVLPGSLDAAVRRVALAKMAKTMDLAADWGTRLVVMHPNFEPIYYRHQPAAWLERAADFFQRLLGGEPGGPLIAIENVADPDPDLLVRLVAAVASPRLVHCFDFGHHRVFGRISVRAWLSRLQPAGHLHFHLHDNDGREDDHLPLGQGDIDWAAARRLLARLPSPFTVTLEPHGDEHRRQTLSYYRRRFLGAGCP